MKHIFVSNSKDVACQARRRSGMNEMFAGSHMPLHVEDKNSVKILRLRYKRLITLHFKDRHETVLCVVPPPPDTCAVYALVPLYLNIHVLG